jgi:hypothetical protein
MFLYRQVARSYLKWPDEALVRVHDVFDDAVTIDRVHATRGFAFKGDQALASRGRVSTKNNLAQIPL